jgi:hypothetical protein
LQQDSIYSLIQLSHYLEKEEYQESIEKMKSLCKKQNQSGYVIIGIIKYMTRSLLPKIDNNDHLKIKYFETLKNILDTLSIEKDDFSFESFKERVLGFINHKNYNDVQKSIMRYEYDSDYIYNEKKSIKHYYSQIISTDYSTKMDKIEYILNRESSESNPNVDLFSPEPIKEEVEMVNLKLLHSDNIQFKNVRKVRLPYCKIAIDITLSAMQIKQIFMNEMKG